MNAGDTFFSNHGGKGEHLWVVISDPTQDPVLAVNFSSIKGGDQYHDGACEVEKNEHPYLYLKSCIRYGDVLAVPKAKLLAAWPLLKHHDPVSPELLKRIREGGLIADWDGKYKRLLIDQGLVPNPKNRKAPKWSDYD